MSIHKEVIPTIFLILYIPWLSTPAQALEPIVHIQDAASWSSIYSNFLKTAGMHKERSIIFKTCVSSTSFKNVRFDRISRAIPESLQELKNIQETLTIQNTKLERMIREMKLGVSIYSRIATLGDQIGSIEGIYEEFQSKLTDTVSKSDGAMCSFAKDLLDGTKIARKVNDMRNIILPFQRLQESVLELIVQDFELREQLLCGTGHSPFEYLHSVYNVLLTVELKGFMMETFAHQFLSSYNGTRKDCEYSGSDADGAVKKAHSKLWKHMKDYNKVFISAMQEASREFRSCDGGKNFTREENFLELEGLFQGILQLPTGAYIRPMDKSGESCSSVDTKSGYTPLYCDENIKFCAIAKNRHCRGRIWNCRTHEQAQACIDKQGPRRYQWVSFGRSEPRFHQCPEDSRISMWNWYSEPCLCQCMDNTVDSTSTHLINLQPVESDVMNNMVITGIKFVVKHQILQFQIQQGKLGQNWKVENTTWKPVNDIGEHIRAARFGRKLRGKDPKVRENEDFLVLKIGENNAFNFDELQVPHEHVLTGVRFMQSQKNEGSVKRIEISLIATKFDYITGKLCSECRKTIITSHVTHSQEYPIHGSPTSPEFPTISDSKLDQYITIQTSDWNSDGAQTTLPLFDAVPLETIPPKPVGGLGLFYKKAGNFSGLVSLKFISLDYVEYIKDSERHYDQLSGYAVEKRDVSDDEE